MSQRSIETKLDKPYSQQPETRLKAARYLVRTGNKDLLVVLGLAVESGPEKAVKPRCDVLDKRTDALRVLGNGVVRQAAALALRQLLTEPERPAHVQPDLFDLAGGAR